MQVKNGIQVKGASTAHPLILLDSLDAIKHENSSSYPLRTRSFRKIQGVTQTNDSGKCLWLLWPNQFVFFVFLRALRGQQLFPG